jgi:hypothetical protein
MLLYNHKIFGCREGSQEPCVHNLGSDSGLVIPIEPLRQRDPSKKPQEQ